MEAESGINLAASTDLTGNQANGGNWLMETDGVNVKDVTKTGKMTSGDGFLEISPSKCMIDKNNNRTSHTGNAL